MVAVRNHDAESFLSITRSILAGAAVSAAVVVGLPSVAAAADTLTVCSSGCDHTTIAAAVAPAAPGDTVLVTEDQLLTAAVTINKDITVTGEDGVTITAATNPRVFNVTSAGDGATISNLEITSATLVAGHFINIAAGANDVTLDGNTVHGPEQVGPMDTWVTNRMWVNGAVTGLSVTGNTFHTLRTGGYIDNGSGVITGNVSYNTKGDYLLDEQADFEIHGNSAGDPTKPSEWSIVIFAVNDTPYDVQALGAANDCLSVWDQATGETYVDADCDGVADTPAPASKDECKKDGWATFNNPSFRNQGDCVSYAARS